MKKVLCKPLSFVPEVSNYSRGIFLFRKVRSFYSLLSIYSERIFFCKKKVSRKPLSFVPEVSINSRGEINYSDFLKTPRQRVWEVSNNSRRIFWKSSVKDPTKRWKISNISRGFFQELTKNTPTNRKANVHIKWTENLRQSSTFRSCRKKVFRLKCFS